MISIIGMGDTAVKESADRIQSAIDESGYVFPKKRVIIMIACDISLNLFKSFTTLLPKKVVPSSRVGSYTMTVAPLALIRFMTPWILL